MEEDEIYIVYQFGIVWGTYTKEADAIQCVSEFPDCRKLVKYKKVE